MIQLTLSRYGNLFSSNQLGFLDIYGVESFNVSRTLSTKTLKNFWFVFHLSYCIEKAEFEAFSVIKSLKIEALANDLCWIIVIVIHLDRRVWHLRLYASLNYYYTTIWIGRPLKKHAECDQTTRHPLIHQLHWICYSSLTSEPDSFNSSIPYFINHWTQKSISW